MCNRQEMHVKQRFLESTPAHAFGTVYLYMTKDMYPT
jgi:hypothetical protein